MKLPKFTLTRRSSVALIAAGVATASIVSASAASLGILGNAKFGSSGQPATACNTAGFPVNYTYAYDVTAGVYDLATASVSGLDAACNGRSVTVVLGASDGTNTAQGSATVSSGAATVTLSPATGSAVVVTQVVVEVVG